jgi:hypothetical protein
LWAAIRPFWPLHILKSVKGTTNLLRYFRRQYFWEIQWKRCMQKRIQIFYIQLCHVTVIVLFVPGKYDCWYVWLLMTFHFGFHFLQAKFVVLLLFFLILSLFFLLAPQVSLHILMNFWHFFNHFYKCRLYFLQTICIK